MDPRVNNSQHGLHRPDSPSEFVRKSPGIKRPPKQNAPSKHASTKILPVNQILSKTSVVERQGSVSTMKHTTSMTRTTSNASQSSYSPRTSTHAQRLEDVVQHRSTSIVLRNQLERLRRQHADKRYQFSTAVDEVETDIEFTLKQYKSGMPSIDEIERKFAHILDCFKQYFQTFTDLDDSLRKSERELNSADLQLSAADEKLLSFDRSALKHQNSELSYQRPIHTVSYPPFPHGSRPISHPSSTSPQSPISLHPHIPHPSVTPHPFVTPQPYIKHDLPSFPSSPPIHRGFQRPSSSTGRFYNQPPPPFQEQQRYHAPYRPNSYPSRPSINASRSAQGGWYQSHDFPNASVVSQTSLFSGPASMMYNTPLVGGILSDDVEPHRDGEDDGDSDASSLGGDEAESVDSDETLPTVVNKYYDKIGDVTLAREHLFNLDTEHALSTSVRQSQRALGRTLAVPEAEFARTYFDERNQLVRKYFESKAEVEKLYDICKTDGHEIEEPNLHPIVDRTQDATHREILVLNLPPADDAEDPAVRNDRRVRLWNAQVARAAALPPLLLPARVSGPGSRSRSRSRSRSGSGSAYSLLRAGAKAAADGLEGIADYQDLSHSSHRAANTSNDGGAMEAKFQGELLERRHSAPDLLNWYPLLQRAIREEKFKMLKAATFGEC